MSFNYLCFRKKTKVNLVIDQGNTRTKFALFAKNELQHFYQSENELAKSTLNDILDHHNPTQCILSSVTDNDSLHAILQKQTIPFVELTHLTRLPFSNLYGTPNTLGKDRLAAIAGAFFEKPFQNCLVIDAGTAITYDFINYKGEYLGGSISPGLQMRFSALKHFTSKLPQVPFNPKVGLTGNDTFSAIQSGVYYGLLNEIDGFMQRYKQFTPDVFVFLTGGDAHLFDKSIKNSIFVAQNLVLSGLNSLLEQHAL